MQTEIVSFCDLRVGDTFWMDGLKSEVQNYCLNKFGGISLQVFTPYAGEIEYLEVYLHNDLMILRKIDFKIAPTIEQFLAQIKA